MDGDGSGLVVHAVDAVAGEPERLTRAVLTRRRRRANGERLVPGAARDHLDADARASVVVVTGIARLPPQIEPRFGVLIAPQQHRLTRAGAVESAWLDQRGCQPGPFRAFVRCQRPVAGGDRSQPRSVQPPNGVPMDGDPTGAAGTLDAHRSPVMRVRPAQAILVLRTPNGGYLRVGADQRLLRTVTRFLARCRAERCSYVCQFHFRISAVRPVIFWVLGADKTGMGRSGVEGKLL